MSIDSCTELDLDPRYGCLALATEKDQNLHYHEALRDLYGDDVLDFVRYDPKKPAVDVETGKHFRRRIDALNQNEEKTRNMVKVFHLLSSEQKRFTYSLLTFLVQLYLRGCGKELEVFTVPYILGWLWFKCAKFYGLPTVATYSALVLYNPRVLDWSQEISLENMTVLHSITSTIDEVWFYKIHMLLEYDGGKLFPIFLSPDEHFSDEELTLATLEKIRLIVKNLIVTLKRMGEHCSPTVYWEKIRYYFEGYNQGIQLELKDGEDDEDLPKEKFYYKGGSGAQSCIFQTLDNFFGINHDNFHGKDFLESQKFYMCEGHRQFLDKVKQQKNLKNVLTERNYLANEQIIEKYNEVLQVFKIYRDVHFGLVHTYMISFLKKEQNVDTFKGTGGADLSWLKDYSKDTEKAKFQVNKTKSPVEEGNITERAVHSEKPFMSTTIWAIVVLALVVGVFYKFYQNK